MYWKAAVCICKSSNILWVNFFRHRSVFFLILVQTIKNWKLMSAGVLYKKAQFYIQKTVCGTFMLLLCTRYFYISPFGSVVTGSIQGYRVFRVYRLLSNNKVVSIVILLYNLFSQWKNFPRYCHTFFQVVFLKLNCCAFAHWSLLIGKHQ